MSSGRGRGDCCYGHVTCFARTTRRPTTNNFRQNDPPLRLQMSIQHSGKDGGNILEAVAVLRVVIFGCDFVSGIESVPLLLVRVRSEVYRFGGKAISPVTEPRNNPENFPPMGDDGGAQLALASRVCGTKGLLVIALVLMSLSLGLRSRWNNDSNQRAIYPLEPAFTRYT